MNEEKNEIVYGAWRPQKYFKSKSPISGETKLFVSVGLLINKWNMSEKTLRNGISKFMRGQSTYYRAFKDQDALMVSYDSLPANCKSKLQLPKNCNDAYSLLKGEGDQDECINRDVEFKHLKQELETLYSDRWPKFLTHYHNTITDQNEKILYAKSHAIISGIIDLQKARWPSKIIFEAYRQIVSNLIDSYEEPIFYTFSPVYFWRKISKCIKLGISNSLVHEMRGKPREYKVKMTGQIKAFIRILFRNPIRYTISSIIKKVETKYNVLLSHSTLKSVKSKTLDRNILEYDSNGKRKSRQNGLPKIIRFLAQSPGDQFQGDWYKIQFFCHNGIRVVRLHAYVVIDVFSRKIIGWSLAEKLLASEAKRAFKMAFIENQFLPEEIVIDNESKYSHKIFKRFIKKLNNIGVITTKAAPDIPTWKAEIESAFAVFQKLHSSKPWFIGEGIKSKNKAGNPSDEIRDKLYLETKAGKGLNVKEMIKEFKIMVEEYNLMTNNRRKKISVHDTFRMNATKHIIKLENWMEPLLFWQVKHKKKIKEDGRIDLQINGEEYIYQVTQAETLWNYKNSYVRVCFNVNDLSRIFIYERFTYKFIGIIEPRLVLERENKFEVLGKHNKTLRDAIQYKDALLLKDQSLVSGIPNNRVRKSVESLEDKRIKRRMNEDKLIEEVSQIKIHD